MESISSSIICYVSNNNNIIHLSLTIMADYSEELYQEMLQDDGIQYDTNNVAEELLEDLFTF